MPGDDPGPSAADPVGCPLGLERDEQGHCVDSDEDPWTAEGKRPPVPPSLTGHHTHDGFMLRMTAGLAGAAAAVEVPVLGKIELSGGGWMSSIDLGGSVADDLLLHARLATARVFDPTLKLDGDEVGNADGAVLGMSHVGVGLTYYIMPYNIYLTGTFGLTLADLKDDTGELDTDAGWGVTADFGKEWWVDPDWGIGIAGRLMLGSVSLDAVNADVGMAGIGVLFTATYQ